MFALNKSSRLFFVAKINIRSSIFPESKYENSSPFDNFVNTSGKVMSFRCVGRLGPSFFLNWIFLTVLFIQSVLGSLPIAA